MLAINGHLPAIYGRRSQMADNCDYRFILWRIYIYMVAWLLKQPERTASLQDNCGSGIRVEY